MINQFGITKELSSKMVAKSFVSLLLGLKLRPFGLGSKMDLGWPEQGRNAKEAFP